MTPILFRLIESCELLGRRWLALTFYKQCAFVLVAYVFKNGLSDEAMNVRDAYLPASKALPEPTGYFSASIGNLVLARAFGVETVNQWIVLHFILLIFVILTTCLLVHRHQLVHPGILIIFIFSLSSISSLTGSLGIYDPVTFLGGIILILARKSHFSLLGAVIMSLGNPEQSILACLILLVLSKIQYFVEWRRRALNGLIIACVIYLLIQSWMILHGLVINRVTALPYFLELSLKNFVSSPFSNLWTWFGIAWFIVISLVAYFPRRERFLLIISILGIPSFVTVITADGARVFSLIVLPSLLVIGIWFWKNYSSRVEDINAGVGLFLVLWISIPTSYSWGYIGNFLANKVTYLIGDLSDYAFEVGKQISNFLN